MTVVKPPNTKLWATAGTLHYCGACLTFLEELPMVSFYSLPALYSHTSHAEIKEPKTRTNLFSDFISARKQNTTAEAGKHSGNWQSNDSPKHSRYINISVVKHKLY